jgi:hypothetical protein
MEKKELCTNIISQKSLNKGFSFESFENYDDFIKSAFFKKYYNLWEEDFMYNANANFIQKYTWGNLSVMNLQRMLVMLGYMNINDLGWYFRELEPDYCSMSEFTSQCDINDPYLYFWVHGKKTNEAIRKFQSESWIVTDWIVWEMTKDQLYTQIFHHIHDAHNPRREEVFKITNIELKKLCEVMPAVLIP